MAAYSLSVSCNESSGTVAHDSTTNHFDFQVHGASWADGIAGNGLVFDGVDDFLGDTNRMCLAKLGGFKTGTIGVSFRLNSLPNKTTFPLCYFGKNTGSSIIIEVGHYNNESKLYFTLATNGVTLCFDSNFNLQSNVWYRFAVVVGTNFNTGYLNGVELTNRHYNYGDARSSLFLAAVDQDTFWVGKGYSANPSPTYLNGEVDEFRISQRPFDSQEILAVYNSIISVWPVITQWQSGPGILLRWPSQPGEKYDVRYRMSLAGYAPWLVLVSNLPASDSETVFLDQNNINPCGFYRVTRSP